VPRVHPSVTCACVSDTSCTYTSARCTSPPLSQSVRPSVRPGDRSFRRPDVTTRTAVRVPWSGASYELWTRALTLWVLRALWNAHILKVSGCHKYTLRATALADQFYRDKRWTIKIW
jgi:hypothetical protein